MKWLFALFYHPLMFCYILVSLILPFMLYGDIKGILANEVPTAPMPFILLSWIMFWVYLAMKSKFLGKLYRKVTILLPLLQMLLYTSTALNVAILVLNKWADQGAYSKTMAIVLAVASIVMIRLLMSLLYWKYPLIRKTRDM